MAQGISRRIERLLQASNFDLSLGYIEVPEDTPAELWPLAMLIAMPDVADGPSLHTLRQCAVCGYPRLSIGSCVNCEIGVRTPQPLPVSLVPPHGVRAVPWPWYEVSFLHQTQGEWCSHYGASIECEVCGYSIANGQGRCLVCLADTLYFDPTAQRPAQP